MRISVALLGLVWPLLTASTVLGQDKPLANAVKLAKSQQANKATTAPDLFALNGIEKANPTALSPNQVIHKLTLKPNALARVWQEKREFLEISIPTANSTVDLELIPSNIFAPGFKVTTATADSTATVDINKTHYYHGILKNNPNSVVSVAIAEDDNSLEMYCPPRSEWMISPSPGKRRCKAFRNGIKISSFAPATRFHGIIHPPANDPARKQIHPGTQIGPSAKGR